MLTRTIRSLAALLGAAGLVALYLEFPATYASPRGLWQFASYFTNLSNTGYILVTLALAFAPAALTATPWFRAARGSVTMAMVLTGVGYAILLPGTMSYFTHPWINYVIHGVMPAIALLDWLLTPPPAPRMRFRDAAWQWLLYPLVWTIYTVLHGWATAWFPYPFLDPAVVGVGGGLVVGAVTTVVLLGIIAALTAYQRLRSGAHDRGERDGARPRHREDGRPDGQQSPPQQHEHGDERPGPGRDRAHGVQGR